MAGIIADACTKVFLAVIYTAGAAALGHRLGVEAWLMIACAAALLICGGIEIGYVRSRPVRTYTRLMVTYDTGWVLATIAGLLLAWQGSNAAGEVWIGYQAAGAIVFAALLVVARAPGSAFGGTASP
ncbi:hypothetical protein [Nocardia sp. NBC_01329]|uniref:hypothetical protein n=1 Tax=Nocardia sp. NBC_01329 TaxID=2903594 RepID=UPI002E0D79BE|nr:hypothetical protein OG405_22600 [Nocardia sp. NBC_01329]